MVFAENNGFKVLIHQCKFYLVSRIRVVSTFKINPMIRNILSACLLLASSLAYSQTSFNQVNIPVGNSPADSAGFFLQKGLEEKGKGRRLESLKNFEKASNYDANNKEIVAELASAYFDLRR